MDTTILASLSIPAAVFIGLTIMLIKEKDYFFHNKSEYEGPKPYKNKKEESYRNTNNNHLDFSGGTMGL